MDPIRIVLVAGMMVHKAVWEVMKRTQPVRASGPDTGAGTSKRVLKLVKVGVLVFLVVQALALDLLPIRGAPVWLRWLGLGLFVLGLGIAILGRVELGTNWADIEDGRVLEGQAMVSHGIYRWIRHPIYAGDMFLLVGLQLALASWLVLAMVAPVAVFVRRALKEEAMLARNFAGYEEYCARTKRFLPLIY